MKRITTLIALMMAAFVGWSQDFSAVCSTGQTLYYTITSSTAPYTVTVDAPENGYGSDMTGALSIPATVSYQGVDYTVTAIGISAFYRCRDITEVTFPNTAKSIGEYSFYQCSGITSIALPNALDSIYGHAFYKCTSLTELTIPNTVTYIGNYAFAHCTSILGNLIIPNTVTTLGESAFFHCSGITGLTLSNAITTIEDHLFTDCTSLVGTLNIPEGVTSIGVEAFYGCSSITRVQLPSTLTYIHTGAFESCAAMTGTLSIPDAVTDIDEMAFNGCHHLTGIRLGNSLTRIGYATFCGCRSIVRLDIPANVTTIERFAFAECERLTWITFPRALTSLGDAVFTQCYQLHGITCYATTPPELGNLVFDQVDTSLQVLVPCECIEAYRAHSDWGIFSNYGEVFGASLVVESINESQGTVEITQYPTCENHFATFNATAKRGYHFVRWSDDVTDPNRTVEVTDDIIYTAYFERNQSIDSIEEPNQSIVSTGHQTIIVSNAEGQQVSIYDLMGRTLYSQKTDNVTYHVPHSGIYLVRIGNRKAFKLIVL